MFKQNEGSKHHRCSDDFQFRWFIIIGTSSTLTESIKLPPVISKSTGFQWLRRVVQVQSPAKRTDGKFSDSRKPSVTTWIESIINASYGTSKIWLIWQSGFISSPLFKNLKNSKYLQNCDCATVIYFIKSRFEFFNDLMFVYKYLDRALDSESFLGNSLILSWRDDFRQDLAEIRDINV